MKAGKRGREINKKGNGKKKERRRRRERKWKKKESEEEIESVQAKAGGNLDGV